MENVKKLENDNETQVFYTGKLQMHKRKIASASYKCFVKQISDRDADKLLHALNILV